jgi:hypothetical protein
LEVGQTDIAFIGISNWELDASKMARFLVIHRPVPDAAELIDTAEKIFDGYGKIESKLFKEPIKALSEAYCKFIREWKAKEFNNYPHFYGLRDFYSLIRYVFMCIFERNISKDDKDVLAKVMRKAVERNFDGMPNSIKTFLVILNEFVKNDLLSERID